MVEIIIKVCKRSDNVKYLIIPKNSDIKQGEYVVVSNNMNMINKIKKEEQNDRKKR